MNRNESNKPGEPRAVFDASRRYRIQCDRRMMAENAKGITPSPGRQKRTMELTTTCSKCDQTIHVSNLEQTSEVPCPACRQIKEFRAPLNGQSVLEACPVCATTDLYVQKDFPHGLGLAIVFAGFAVSTVFWYYFMPGWALGVLLFTALLDGLLYRIVPDVTICYRCLSQIRGHGSNQEARFKPFDLAIGERYRQERIRIEEMRKSAEIAGASSRQS